MSEASPPQVQLSIVEIRVLGCLCEKEATTPDYYPLSLNGLTNACNQKSNRQPVMNLSEDVVAKSLESLRSKKLCAVVSQAESRVAKYKHTLDSVYPIPTLQRAILTELLIRGPQTAGELKTRCERMTSIDSLAAVREELQEMGSGSHPILVELPKQSGKKDPRFAHLLGGPVSPEESSVEASGPLSVEVSVALPPEAEERLIKLEATVAEQVEEIQWLKTELARFRAEFE